MKCREKKTETCFMSFITEWLQFSVTQSQLHRQCTIPFYMNSKHWNMKPNYINWHENCSISTLPSSRRKKVDKKEMKRMKKKRKNNKKRKKKKGCGAWCLTAKHVVVDGVFFFLQLYRRTTQHQLAIHVLRKPQVLPQISTELWRIQLEMGPIQT